MKILVASDQWFPDLRGGSARVASETARRLAQRGHEVTVLAPKFDGEPAHSTVAGVNLLRVLPRTVLPQTFTDPIATARNAARAGTGFDVLVGHQSTTASGLDRAKLDAPIVRVFHAPAVREARFMRSRLPIGRDRFMAYALDPFLVGLERRSVRTAAKIVVLSEFSRTLLLADFPGSADRVRLARGGVDSDQFTPGDGVAAARARLGVREDATVLFTVRRLEPRMGLEQLLEAAHLLGGQHELVIAGTGMLERELRRLADELGIGNRTRFLGRISDTALREWYRAADLMVLPTIAYEGFGLVTAEALACGTPVIGTPVGATPELLAPLERRLLAGAADAPSLAAAIDAMLGDIDDDFRRRCREYAVTRLSWDAAMDGWEHALAEVATTGAVAASPCTSATLGT